jgi:hypothetical protein
MAEPTKKSEGIENFLRSCLGVDRRESIKGDVCIAPPLGCGGPAVNFKDELSRKEYTISGMCQNCQDEFYLGGSDG